MGQKRYAESEVLLLGGYQGLLRRRATIPAPYRAVLERTEEWILRLYRDWERPQKAAEWLDRIRKS
jgi:hypothetical protein